MNILFKFMFKNIFEKKLRFTLIIFSVAVATAMTFASIGVSTSYSEMVLERMKSTVGEADLIIYGNKDKETYFVNEDVINEKLKYGDVSYVFDGDGSYKDNNTILKVNIKGCNIEEFNKVNPVSIVDKDKEVLTLQGNEVIISKDISDKLNLKEGDSFFVRTEKKDVELKVKYIAINKGIFLESPGQMNILIDNEGFSDLVGRDKFITTALINLSDDSKIENVIKYYESNLENYKVLETVPKEILNENIKQFTLPFYIMLVVVLIMASFIIYSAYKIIVVERMAVIGTFRSIGATKLSTNLILILESLIYGILGGLVGLALGFPILYYLCDSANVFKSYGIETSIVVNNINFLYSFILAIVISVLSSIIPIIGASKTSVKDIILGSFSENTNLKVSHLTLGMVLIVIPYIYISKYKLTGIFLISIICPFSIFIGMALICPYIMKIFAILFKGIYRFVFGNLGAIAIDNLKSSKALINNIALLMSTLAAVVAIYVASNSVNTLVNSRYEDMNYDFKMEGSKLKVATSEFENLSYLDNYMEQLILNNVDAKLKDDKFTIKQIEAVKIDKFSDFYSKVRIYDDKDNSEDQILSSLDGNHNILISDIVAKKENIKIGDTIELSLKDKNIKYNVVGYLESDFINNLGIAILDVGVLKEDINIDYGNTVLIQTNNSRESDSIERTLKEDLEDYNLAISSKNENLKRDLEANKGLMNSLESFSIMALLIGSLGMMNNLMVSFMYRKREFAVLASVGMSKLQTARLLFIEGLTVGIIGGTLGALEGSFISTYIEDITYSLDVYLKVDIPLKLVVALGMLGALLIVISSVVPIIKSSKLSVVEEIKYE